LQRGIFCFEPVAETNHPNKCQDLYAPGGPHRVIETDERDRVLDRKPEEAAGLVRERQHVVAPAGQVGKS